MPKHRQEVGRQVAAQLFATERAIDQALAEAAALAGLMPSARTDARLSAIVGQTAIARAAKAVSALVKARQNIVETHQALSDVQGQLGLQTVSYGSYFDKPPMATRAPQLVPVERMASQMIAQCPGAVISYALRRCRGQADFDHRSLHLGTVRIDGHRVVARRAARTDDRAVSDVRIASDAVRADGSVRVGRGRVSAAGPRGARFPRDRCAYQRPLLATVGLRLPAGIDRHASGALGRPRHLAASLCQCRGLLGLSDPVEPCGRDADGSRAPTLKRQPAG